MISDKTLNFYKKLKAANKRAWEAATNHVYETYFSDSNIIDKSDYKDKNFSNIEKSKLKFWKGKKNDF